ncbi:hypothetical protein EN812_05885 [Mesorhizobium sp. M4B.F.Ca.ET.169.01.1.1]|uniref:hypothetical protein n=1 Tax=Mesorhizobium sp. M4B.F.Ca.ET.169.01.1.1 TaxID=2563949 RepID=UPI00109378FD|nr:hypothetical protein [Mesorhizobium sp. M4B.F.Ca.ET.169.01.1.1]TGT46866.1 hypothetical protein EN812_05885 [Mesorhizobium sp. M4B.F.Ca.ET.169.01.1.1]
MRFRVLFCASLCAFGASAQESPKIIYVPKIGDIPGQVIYLGTMKAVPVIASEGAQPPDDCPAFAFWKKNNALVSCGDGTEYEFVKLDKSSQGSQFENALGLKPLSKPDPGTDDPGPMRDSSKKEQKP